MRSWTASASARWRWSVCSVYAYLLCVYAVVWPCIGECARSVSCVRGCRRAAHAILPMGPGCADSAVSPATTTGRGTAVARQVRRRCASSPSWSPRSRRACVREPPLLPPGASRWRASTWEEASAWMRPTLVSSTNGHASLLAGASRCVRDPRMQTLPERRLSPSHWPADSATASERPWLTSWMPSGTALTMRKPSKNLAALPPPVPSCPRASSRPFPWSESCPPSRWVPHHGISTRARPSGGSAPCSEYSRGWRASSRAAGSSRGPDNPTRIPMLL